MSNQAGAWSTFLVKWILIPVALAAIGFFIIGPRIGGSIAASPEPEPTVSTSDPLTQDIEEEPKKFHSEPKIDIEATPVRSSRSRRTSGVKVHEPDAKPPEQTGETEPGPEPDAPPTDNGDTTGGATTTGG